MPELERPQACEIEIVERVPADQIGSGEPIVPNEIRINGRPVLAPKDHPPHIHDIVLDDSNLVQVTLTVFARLVHIGEEAK